MLGLLLLVWSGYAGWCLFVAGLGLGLRGVRRGVTARRVWCDVFAAV